MKLIYERNYAKLLKLIPDLLSLKVEAHRRSQREGFMDLHFDVLNREEKSITIALYHYYKQNGDAIPDPDIELLIYPVLKMAEVIALQGSWGYRVVFPNYPNKNMVDLKAKQELNRFLS